MGVVSNGLNVNLVMYMLRMNVVRFMLVDLNLCMMFGIFGVNIEEFLNLG